MADGDFIDNWMIMAAPCQEEEQE